MMWFSRLSLVTMLLVCEPIQSQSTQPECLDDPDPTEASSPTVTDIINKYAEQWDIDPLLIAAILTVESNFGEMLESADGQDHGPMQINRWWFRRLGIRKHDVMSMEGGIKWGTKILAMNRDEHRGRGCWWSLYNSHNPRARKRYEMKIRDVFARLDLKPDCSSVKPSESLDI